jgi:predicted HD superfamily hydrolase involved in NAD metabolism
MTDYHALIRQRLNEKRRVHSENTAAEAEKLAKRYGCDEQKAYTAGLLHDIAKCLSQDEASALAAKYGVAIDEYAQNNPELIHGPLGAAIVQNELKIRDEEILDAIRYHTTGRRGMSLMEKIIYLADVIEPTNVFEGVEDIRRMAYEDLDGAIVLSAINTLDFVLKRRLVIHPDTVDAYNDIMIIKRRNLIGTKV